MLGNLKNSIWKLFLVFRESEESKWNKGKWKWMK
jgi:hypothetical protein